MSFIVKPGRNSIVRNAFAGLRAEQRREAKSTKADKAKPEVVPPAPAKKSKTAKPSRAKGGKPSKAKP